ncbi:DUF305 domain-containing protein [bacterium]|nr:DUF305 domain-containing protein [bacterium]
MKTIAMNSKRLLSLLLTGLLLPTLAFANGRRVQNTTPPPYTPRTDADFIEALVPHHLDALEMARVEVERGTRPEVRAIAEGMIADQTREIALMIAEYRDLTGRSRVPPPPTDRHMRNDMALLDRATGAAVDAVFLEQMIPHHAGALVLAHRALPYLRRQALRDLAQNVQNAQAAEIGEMQELKVAP